MQNWKKMLRKGYFNAIRAYFFFKSLYLKAATAMKLCTLVEQKLQFLLQAFSLSMIDCQLLLFIHFALTCRITNIALGDTMLIPKIWYYRDIISYAWLRILPLDDKSHVKFYFNAHSHKEMFSFTIFFFFFDVEFKFEIPSWYAHLVLKIFFFEISISIYWEK